MTKYATTTHHVLPNTPEVSPRDNGHASDQEKKRNGMLHASKNHAYCGTEPQKTLCRSINLPVQFELGNQDIIDANFVSAVTDVVFECCLVPVSGNMPDSKVGTIWKNCAHLQCEGELRS